MYGILKEAPFTISILLFFYEGYNRGRSRLMNLLTSGSLFKRHPVQLWKRKKEKKNTLFSRLQHPDLLILVLQVSIINI